MVRLVSSTPSLYNLLSIATYRSRLRTMYGVEIWSEVDHGGRRTVQMGGFGLNPNHVIGLTVLAMSASGRRVAGWNGIDDAPIIAGVSTGRRFGPLQPVTWPRLVSHP